MKKNVKSKIISIILYISAFLGLVAACFIALFLTTISCDSESTVTLECFLIGGGIGLLTLILYSILPFITAVALQKETHWWKFPLTIYSILILFAPPIGTSLGVYYLVYINNFKNSRNENEKPNG